MSTSPEPATKPPRSERSFRYRVVAAFVIPFLHTIARYRWIDAHKVPAQGAFVFAPNHYSNIDPLVMAYALYRNGRIPRFLAKGSLFTLPIIGAWLRYLGQIPVERPGAGAANAHASLSSARELVEEGKAVIVYPEGTLTREPDLWPMRGKTGAVRLALQNDLPLIPAVHWGTQDVMPRYKNSLHIFPRKTITVKIGDPVDMSAYRDRPLDTALLNAATDTLMDAITELLETVRGEQAPATRWDPKDHNQKETGKF